MKKGTTGHHNTVRIISGIYRSRLVQFPDASGLRPTADRIRETLFNWLRNDIYGARCLDLFAGSGALGFESLSRGASWVEFVDSSLKAQAAISATISEFGISNACARCAQADTWIDQNTNSTPPFSIVFLDPPFSAGLLPEVYQRLDASGLLGAGCKIYVESADVVDRSQLPDGWQELKSKQAGQVRYYLFQTRDRL